MQNEFRGNFFFPNENEVVNTTTLVGQKFEFYSKLRVLKLYAQVVIKPWQNVNLKTIVWYRTSFTVFIANFSALVISIQKSFQYIMSNYNHYTMRQAMLGSLYGQSDSNEQPGDPDEGSGEGRRNSSLEQDRAYRAKRAFEKSIRSR